MRTAADYQTKPLVTQLNDFVKWLPAYFNNASDKFLSQKAKKDIKLILIGCIFTYMSAGLSVVASLKINRDYPNSLIKKALDALFAPLRALHIRLLKFILMSHVHRLTTQESREQFFNIFDAVLNVSIIYLPLYSIIRFLIGKKRFYNLDIEPDFILGTISIATMYSLAGLLFVRDKNEWKKIDQHRKQYGLFAEFVPSLQKHIFYIENEMTDKLQYIDLSAENLTNNDIIKLRNALRAHPKSADAVERLNIAENLLQGHFEIPGSLRNLFQIFLQQNSITSIYIPNEIMPTAETAHSLTIQVGHFVDGIPNILPLTSAAHTALVSLKNRLPDKLYLGVNQFVNVNGLIFAQPLTTDLLQRHFQAVVQNPAVPVSKEFRGQVAALHSWTVNNKALPLDPVRMIMAFVSHEMPDIFVKNEMMFREYFSADDPNIHIVEEYINSKEHKKFKQTSLLTSFNNAVAKDFDGISEKNIARRLIARPTQSNY